MDIKGVTGVKAFSLVELLIGMTILSVLATIGFISYVQYNSKTRDTIRNTDLKTLERVLGLHYTKKLSYPVPTNSIDISYSGAVFWSQGVFGNESIIETGKIFGDLVDPKYGNKYTYSVTSNNKEYQIGAVFENNVLSSRVIAATKIPELFPKTYAAGEFSPLELSPIIWLDGEDIDGDGDTGDNPPDGSNISSWVNKSSVGSPNNPVFTNGVLQYSDDGYDSNYPGVFINSNRGMRLENSDITQGDIFYVVQKNDPFSGTDNNGYGLYSTTNENYLIGYRTNRRDALRIGNSPNHSTNSPSTTNSRTAPFIYSFHTDNTNYSFRDTGREISEGATNSIAGITWAFNNAGAVSNQNADLIISEILIFDSKLSEVNVQKVEGYLAHKWGQDDWLPSAHPYKNDAPESSGPPPSPDTTPDAFILSDVTDAEILTEYISNSIVVNGINTPSPVSISGAGAEYSVNNGVYTSTSSNVSLGDNIKVRMNSSSSNSTTTTATLSIGGVSEGFSVTTLVADVTPDSFSFSPITDADVSTAYTSNAITVSGINTQAQISISGAGAQYRISDSIYTDLSGAGIASASSTYWPNDPSEAFDDTSAGWGNNGSMPAILMYDFGSGQKKIITKYTLYRDSAQPGNWANNAWSPKNWIFQGSDNGTSWDNLDTRTNEEISYNATKKEFSFSNTDYYRYYRINISSSVGNNSWVNISEMELIGDDDAGFTSNPGVVNEGDVVSIRATSGSAGVSVTASIDIGTVSEDFIITSLAPDTTPNSISFNGVSNANLATSYTSNTLTISGINTASPISISGTGEYSINGGTYTSVSGNINEGDIVNIRMTSSSSNSVTVSSTLTIGGVSGTYNISTPAPPPDTTPDSFSFQDITEADLSTEYISNTITISGINTSTAISVSGGEYDINGSKSYTSSAGTVNNGDIVSVKTTSSPSGTTTSNTTLNVGGVSDIYSVTTFTPDTAPDIFEIGDVSNADINTSYISDAIIVTGINTTSSISISSPGEYSINGGIWETSAGNVEEADQVRVRNTASSSWNSNTSITLTIGGVSDTFLIDTGTGDTSPDTFLFNDVTDASFSTQYISDTITITGINAPTPISITGGMYRIGATGSFTGSIGQVTNGQEVTLQTLSPAGNSSVVNVVLQVGDQSDTYSVSTSAYSAPRNESPEIPISKVYVRGNYNGLLVHAYTGATHFIAVAPSIITYDPIDTDIISIAENKKFVYEGFENIPASYVDQGLTMSGGFDFTIPTPILYEGSKVDLGSYGGLQQVDEGIRSQYNNFPAYAQVASYLDDYSLGYLEDILSSKIGINPIKPFYCSDILRSKLIYNIAGDAIITASPTAYNSYGTGGIANGIKSTQGDLDYEYHSDSGNASINFAWPTAQKIGYVRIYNRTGCCSDRLSGANIKLFDVAGDIIYSHPLWDTTGDYVIDLDLEGIGQLHNVKQLSIESVDGNFLNLREVEIFLGGNVQDGTYKVDKDGLGGQSPYNVYCDMTTDGGGWTRIGEDYIENGKFIGGAHVYQHNFEGFDNLNDNLIVSSATKTPPSTIPDAFVIQHNGSINDSYRLYFSDIPGEYFAQEIRLSAWVDGTNSSIFYNNINYSDGSSSITTPEFEIIEEIGTWQHQMVRIPLSGLVSDFTWDVAEGVAGPFYFTGLKMEVYYR